MEDLEKLFEQDSREKKIIARGIHNRASRTGRLKGGMKTPVDLLTGADKRKYKGTKRSKTYSIAEYFEKFQDPTILKYLKIEEVPLMRQKDMNNEVTYKDFLSLGKEVRRSTLAALLMDYKEQELADYWGITKQRVHNLKYKLDLTKKRTKPEIIIHEPVETIMPVHEPCDLATPEIQEIVSEGLQHCKIIETGDQTLGEILKDLPKSGGRGFLIDLGTPKKFDIDIKEEELGSEISRELRALADLLKSNSTYELILQVRRVD